MKHVSLLCCAILAGVVMSAAAVAAESAPPIDLEVIETPFGTEARTYYREHRLRAYQRTRALTSQGANCVTPKMVCWIDQPIAEGESCACEAPRLGVVPGIVGG